MPLIANYHIMIEKYIFESHNLVVDFQKKIKNHYHNFLNSKIFWLSALIIIPAFLLHYNLFFFRENLYFFTVYFLLTIFLLGLLMPPIFYKIKGLDFFALKRKYFQKEKIKSTNEESIVNSFSEELTEYLYYIMHDECRILDTTLVSDKSDCLQNLPDLFSKNYIVDSVNNLKIYKHTDTCIYMTCDQKVAGYIIHEIFRPLLKIETKQLCNYFYYYKNNEFRKVNYDSINSTSKRRELNKVKPRIQELLSKSYV